MPGLERLAGRTGSINAPASPTRTRRSRIGAIHRGLADEVHDALRAARGRCRLPPTACRRPVSWRGWAARRHDPVLLWLDAHGDFNTPETSLSGFIGGMPLAMLVGRGEPWLRENVGLAALAERDVTLSDARDLDPEAAISLRASRVAVVRRVADIAAHLPPTRPVYVHFDADIIARAKRPR